jgi:uncharacterized protein (DUF2062 family)
MLFRSREKPDLLSRLRTAVWPRVSWQRSIQYFRKRVLRLSGSPHSVALGVAIGVGVSCTPFFGFHTVIALAIAFLVGGNLVGAALGTVFFNPLTAPFITAAAFRLGRMFVGGPTHFRSGGDVPANLIEKLMHGAWPWFKQAAVGGIPLGISCGIVAYVIVVMTTTGFQNMRRERLAERRRQNQDQASTPVEPRPAERI